MQKNTLYIFAILLLNMISIRAFAQAPTLGTAATYNLFTSVGAVGNTGISQVTGNVGTNSGAITGFGNVNGNMHTSDLSTSLAAADLLIAYNQLNAAIPTFFPAPLMGNGDTLEAGVYRINGVTTLGGELVLDAQGNANAVFIFQIQAAFSSGAGSKVKLINGALACNVFWKIEGLVSLAPETYMRGSIIANNAAINMNTHDTLEGRALSTAGAITISGVMSFIPSGCGSVVLQGPIPPYLGSVACYTLFTGNGPATNAGITYATGDIGTNVGLTTGFNPLFVNGTIHPIPDGSTTMAAADLLVAYNYLSTVPVDIQLLYPAQFGNDLVLTPHTYLLDAATTFTGNLFLNAEGNANAVFIIKINGALSTSTYSKVILRNGTTADHVYWLVEGAVEINNYSVFNGTLISNNGAINLNTGDSINGRALTTNGALSTAAIVSNAPGGPCFALGTHLVNFDAVLNHGEVMLYWNTLSEESHETFIIDRSDDGTSFRQLGSLPHQANGQYAITDHQPAMMNYYRLAQSDADGHLTYLKTIAIANPVSAFHAFTFQSGNSRYLDVNGTETGLGFIELYSMDGSKLSSQAIQLSGQRTVHEINMPSGKGLFIIHLKKEGNILFRDKLF